MRVAFDTLVSTSIRRCISGKDNMPEVTFHFNGGAAKLTPKFSHLIDSMLSKTPFFREGIQTAKPDRACLLPLVVL